MTDQQLHTKLRKIIAAVLCIEPHEIDLDADFANDLGADDVDMMEICLALEDEFGTDIDTGDFQNITNLDELADWLRDNVVDL